MAKLTLQCDNELIDAFLLAQSIFKTLKQRVNLTVEISFCSEQEIREINKEQRGIDRVTDVLSFPALQISAGEIIRKKDHPFDFDPETKGIFLGSIIICEKRASEQAEEYGHSLKREVNYLALHGLLHLFGYDHETDKQRSQMRVMEERILCELGITREN